MIGAPHTLLVTFPLDHDGFVERCRAPDIGDAVRFWSHKFTNGDVEGLWPVYKRLASRIKKVCQDSVSFGVNVICNASRGDLQTALKSDAVVTLFAHWKNSRVFPFDFLSVSQALAPFARDATNKHLMIRQLIGPHEVDRMAKLPDELARHAAVQAFNRVVEEHDLQPTGQSLDDDPDEFRQSRNRAALDYLYQQAIKPGNRLELWDQMIDEATFAALVPRARKAGIDLAVCNSAIMARTLQFTCNCPVVVNRCPAGILFRLDLYLHALAHSARTGAPYIETLLHLRDDLLRDGPTNDNSSSGARTDPDEGLL